MKAVLCRLVRAAALRLLRVHASYGAAAEALREGGPAIVCANHVSLLDGVIVALASPVPLVFGVDTDFSRRSAIASRGMGALARLGFGAVVPVDSTAPFGMRSLRRALMAGHPVMVFPEGRIGDGHSPLPAQPGVDWLVSRTGARVVRVSIHGAERSRLFARTGRHLWPRIDVRF